MTNEEIGKLLDKQDSEHDQLVQPRELDKQLRRLARIGLWADKHRYAIVSGLSFLKEASEDVDWFDDEEADELKVDAIKALEETIWSKE